MVHRLPEKRNRIEMATTQDVPTSTLSQVDAQQAANEYLRLHIALGLETASPIFVPGASPTWRMLVRLSGREPIATVGTIAVDAQTGQVIPLTVEQMEDMRDRLKEHAGETAGILRPTAQRRANGYLTNYVSLFAKADRPVWVAGDRPVWRATVFLRLRGQGRVCDLGIIDVDAQTGEVMSLSNQQLQAMRKRAHDAATHPALAAATPG
jgi:hypothetical protein